MELKVSIKNAKIILWTLRLLGILFIGIPVVCVWYGNYSLWFLLIILVGAFLLFMAHDFKGVIRVNVDSPKEKGDV